MEDRRKRHTRKKIFNAMIDCLSRTSLEKVTVTMLCNLADINRNTFYSHYPDPLTVYKQIERETMENMKIYFEEAEKNLSPYQTLMVPIFKYIKANARTILALLEANSVSFKEAHLEFLRQQKLWNFDLNETETRYAEEYFVSGSLSIIRKWLIDGTVESPEFMAELIPKFIKHANADKAVD